ncbi:MAG: glucose-6-phosphate isomerase [Pseudomonadales bacterium]|nr:glucose-6-phosphate isomerase [Pseudomonadales bacterium]
MTPTPPAWTHLQSLAERAHDTNIASLVNSLDRLNRFSLSLNGLHVDFSKHLVTDDVFDGLVTLARECGLSHHIEQLMSGAVVNVSEGRAALHTALRNPSHQLPDDFREHVYDERKKMRDLSDQIRNGSWRGSNGQSITDVVNIGIGGSDLGPKMVTEALREFHDGPRVHFLSNVDGAEIFSLLPQLNAASTLIVICSKTFTTQETMLNTKTAMAWLKDELNLQYPAASTHCIGITGSPQKAENFGIPPGQLLTFKDSVGGRYSTWSSIGFSACVAIGYEHFLAFLEGGAAMDQHFSDSSFEKNIPVISALLGIWYNNFLKAQSYAVVPYCQRLRLLVDHLQQLDMESNGKSATSDNQRSTLDTGPIVWGQTGTNGQHAFFQLLHQGQKLVPVDFIGVANDDLSNDEHHRILLVNMVAQAQALMNGKTGEDAHRFYPGNRPSTTMLIDELTPFNMGMLLALYEHKVYVQSIIWGTNAFDQWGVELGKQLTHDILEGDGEQDPSTRALLKKAGIID